MSYEDPENKQEIIDGIKNLTTSDELQAYIQTTYPGWLSCSFTKYSKDYPFLEKNWEILCNELKVAKRKIVLVSNITFDEKHTVLSFFCEYLTKLGYVVRRQHEFIGCQICGSAIPAEGLWGFMREKHLPVPENWANKCSSCSSSC